MIEAPTGKEAFEAHWLDSSDLTLADEHHDASWRHGAYITEVFYRKSDETFWRFKYKRSTDGEFDGLRDGDYEVEQVWPQKELVTVYRAQDE
jgi:hypothetical protein